MVRLPMPGAEEGSWGNTLNTYLLHQHNNDGTHDVKNILGIPNEAGLVLSSSLDTDKGFQWVDPSLFITNSTLAASDDLTVQGSLSVVGNALFTSKAVYDSYFTMGGADANGVLITATATNAFNGGGLYGLNARGGVMNGASSETVNWVAGGKLNAYVSNSCAATVLTLRGAWMVAEHAGTGNVTSASAGVFQVFRTNTGGITDAVGARITDIGGAGSGVIGNQYGVYVESQFRGSTSNYAIYTNKGTVRFGDTVVFDGGVVTRRTTVADLNYTVLAGDHIVSYTALTTPRTVTLPATTAGKTYIIKDETGKAGMYAITVTTTSGTIEGAANKAITTNFGWLKLYYNGTNWYIIS